MLLIQVLHAITLDACLYVFIHKGETVKVLYPYDAQLKDELTIEPGDIIEVENKCGKWWRGKIKGKSQPAGLFCEEFVLPYDPILDINCHDVILESCREFIGYSVMYKEGCYYVTEKPGSDLECIICQGLASDACQTGCCGHTVCFDCGGRWKEKNDSCPHCRKSPLSLVDDPRNKRYIAGLNLYCSNYDVGCDWKGSLNDIHGHLGDDCQFTIVGCKYASCSEEVLRRDLEDHEMNKCPMRPVSCPCCKESRIATPSHKKKIVKKRKHISNLTYYALISTHYKHCPSWPMRCPNNCGTEEKLTRSTLQDHIDNNCPEQVVSCQFAEAGCTVRVKRREMADHIQKSVGEHLTAMMKDYMEVKNEYAKLQNDHEMLKQELRDSTRDLQDNHDALREDHNTLQEDFRNSGLY